MPFFYSFSGDRTASLWRESSLEPHNNITTVNGFLADHWPLAQGDVATETFTAPSNTPLSLQLTLSTWSGVGMYANNAGSIDGKSLAWNKFGSTFSFATSGPVFNLPTGVTANSASAQIVDNNWLGQSVHLTTVPLPPGAWLFGSTLLSIVLLKRSSDRKLD